MKRLTAIALLFVLLVIPCAGASENYFYYDYSNEAVNSAIESQKQVRIYNDKRYLTQWYLPEGETVDESKISHGTDKIYWQHDWSGSTAIEFLNASDKMAYLQAMGAHTIYWYPCYYDDVQIPYFESLYRFEDGEISEISHGNNMDDRLEAISRLDPVYTAEQLKQDGLEAYEPLYSMILQGSWFVYAEKDGENYLIYMPTEEDSGHWHGGGIENNQELLQNRVLTIEQAIEFMTKYQQAIDALPESTNLVGGTEATGETESRNATWIYWLGGGGVVVIVGVAVLLLVLRRKKHN